MTRSQGNKLFQIDCLSELIVLYWLEHEIYSRPGNWQNVYLFPGLILNSNTEPSPNPGEIVTPYVWVFRDILLKSCVVRTPNIVKNINLCMKHMFACFFYAKQVYVIPHSHMLSNDVTCLSNKCLVILTLNKFYLGNTKAGCYFAVRIRTVESKRFVRTCGKSTS